jgi:hypothetical protein
LEAITKGLLSSPSKPAFLIHLSGTGIVADWHDPTYLGKLNPKVWSDISNIDEITSRPDGELHRQTEKYLQSVVAKHNDKLKIAIICPPDIYGPGRGPGRQQSVYFPVFVKEMEKVGPPFYVGEGTNTRSWVHIEDLMAVYLKLVEAAVAGGGNVDWGKEVKWYLRLYSMRLLTVPGLLFHRFPGGIPNRHSRRRWQDPQAPRPNRGCQSNPAPVRTSQANVGSVWSQGLWHLYVRSKLADEGGSSGEIARISAKASDFMGYDGGGSACLLSISGLPSLLRRGFASCSCRCVERSLCCCYPLK